MARVEMSVGMFAFKSVVLFAMLYMSTGVSFAKQNETDSSIAEDVVKNFCQLDAEGKRLRGDMLRQFILPLVTWKEEAGDVIEIIKGFKVGKGAIVGDRAEITVEYQYLGSTNFFEFFAATKQTGVTVYKLVKQKDKWLINEPVMAPHVYWETAISYLKPLETDELKRRAQLESIIKRIKEAAKRKK